MSVLAPASAASGERVLVVISDGMRHDLMKRFVADGVMPAYAEILATGAEADGGMIPNVPANSGPGWAALITGASPAVNGVTNNTFHDNTQPVSPWGVSAWTAGVNQAETILDAAEDAGLTVMSLGVQTFDTASIPTGVVMDSYPDWSTGRGIVANYEVPLQWTDLLATGPYLSNTVVEFVEAEGWTNAPDSFSPAQEAPLAMLAFSGTPVDYLLYIFDSTDDGTTNYDRVMVAPGKDAAEGTAIVGVGEWSEDIPATVDDVAGGFYVKLLELAPDLSQFRLYFTPVTRARAWPESVEEDVVANFDAIKPIDYSPYILGMIDAETFVEQQIDNAELLGQEIYPYLIRTYEPDLVLAGSEATDAIQHRFLSLAIEGSDQYDAENGPAYYGYLEAAYRATDDFVRALWDEMPDAHVFVTSDHGFHSTGMAINANLVLESIGLYNPADPASSQVVAFGAGGLLQVYIKVVGRNPDGVVAEEDYELLREQIVSAFEDLGPDVIDRALLKEETESIPITDEVSWNMLHPDRTGDVVVFSKPPYQFDAAMAGEVTAPTPIYGQHGFLPTSPESRSVFAAAGPTIDQGIVIGPVTAMDLAPTVAAILGIDVPAQAQGSVLPMLLEPVTG
ncbi:MAG TPA: alkaline phosphatase family protein [Aggregatilineaceae bacterium]|nr:alkaline phosphatase family protein [Aggregatilineaceae bacterium]